MPDKKEFRGLLDNDCSFIGKVVGDPVANGEHWFLTLRTVYLQKDANGQFVDVDVDVPLMVAPGGPVNVVQNHVKAERQLLVKCVYSPYEAGGAMQHVFTVKQLKLGHRPYEGPPGGTGTPPLPA